MLIDNDAQINAYRLLTLRQGLKLQAKGIRMSSKVPQASAIVKKEFGFKGNLDSITRQFEDYLIANSILKVE
jgi:hypothetical protein